MAVDNIEEFSKKFRHTFIRWKPDDTVFVSYIDGCDLDAETVHLSTETVGTVMLKYPLCLQTLDLNTPDSGLFNHNDHALYLFKVPARQWQRGLCAANHEIYNPFAKLFSQGVYRAQFGRAAVHSIFSENYMHDINVAINKIINTGVKSLAITRNLMLSKPVLTNVEWPLIWYKTIPIGHIRDRKFVIEDMLYQQEVQDELQRIGQGQWISY